MPVWVKLGRKCYHAPTGEVLLVISISKNGILAKPVNGRGRRIVKVDDLRRGRPYSPFTDQELQTAKAWGLTPRWVRQTQREGE